MAAVFGGTNAMMTLTNSLKLKESDDFASRICRNQQIILKKESFFDKVEDPTKGSYFIDYLVNEILKEFNIKKTQVRKNILPLGKQQKKLKLKIGLIKMTLKA